MKLRHLKKIVDQCVQKAETTDPDVTFYFGDTELEVSSVGQFSVVPDVNFYLRKKVNGRKK